ncbi:MAG: LCP family protein, partial [Rudaea sp.]
ATAPAITPVLLDAPQGGTNSTPPATALPPVRDRGLVPPTTLNIILMGTDRRPGQLNWRTDTLILVSIDQEAKTVGLLSIPRDLWVRIPGIGAQRINTADFYGEYYHLPGGGPQTIKTTIEQNLGIRVHYYARVDFQSFRKAIDTLGGVDIDVDCSLQETGFYDDLGRADLNFQPGVQHMDGATALRYARSRYTTNDFDRSRRQRKVLLAMWDKALSLNLLPKWPELYGQFRESVQTDLGPVEMAALAFIGSQLRMDKIKMRSIDNRSTIPWTGPNGESVLLPNSERIHSLFVEYFAQPTLGVDPFEEEKARVQVFAGDKQTADVATLALKRQGFSVADPEIGGVVPPASSLLVNTDKPASVQRLLSALRINPSAVKTNPDPSAQIDIQVLLGRDYNACQK